MRIVSANGIYRGVMDSFMRVLANAIAAALVREFGMDQAFAISVSSSAGSLQLARWMAKNGVTPERLSYFVDLIGKFNKAKPKLKTLGKSIDLTSYTPQDAAAAIQGISATMTQTRQSLPPELISIVSMSLGKAMRLNPSVNQDKARQIAFEWMAKKLQYDKAAGVTSGIRGYGHPVPPAGVELYVIKQIVEDRREIADAVGEYLAFVMDKKVPGVQLRPITDFMSLWTLSTYVDEFASPEESESKYTINEPDPGIEGTKIIPLPNGYRAIRIATWSERFADELCKVARWCVRNPKQFNEEYNISEKSPIYLLLKGTRQIGLLSLVLALFKDARDASIGESSLVPREMIGEIYEVLVALSSAERVPLATYGDFMVFMEQFIRAGDLKPSLLLDLNAEYGRKKQENEEAADADDEKPHSETEMEVLEEAVGSLTTTYAEQYLRLVANSDLSKESIGKIVQMTWERVYRRKKDSFYKKTEAALGDIAMKTIRQHARNKSGCGGYCRLFSFLSSYTNPKDFFELAQSTDDANLLRIFLKEVIDNVHRHSGPGFSAASEEYKDAAAHVLDVVPMESYLDFVSSSVGKILSNPESKRYLREDLGKGRYLVGNIPVPRGYVILEDEDGDFLIKDSRRIVISAKLHAAFDLEKRRLSDVARRMQTPTLAFDKVLDSSSVTLQQADEIYRLRYDGRWPYLAAKTVAKLEFSTFIDRSLKAASASQGGGVWDRKEGSVFRKLTDAGYAEITRRLLGWNGDLSEIIGESWQMELDSDLTSGKLHYGPWRGPLDVSPTATASWISSQCRFSSRP